MNTRQVSRLQLFALVITTAMMLVACVSPALMHSDVASIDPLPMVDTFHYSINSGDVDAVLDLFADDAIVIDSGSVIEGRSEIRNWVLYSQRMAGLHLTKLNSEMDGEKVIWLDIAHDGPKVEYRLYILRWEALIQEGKIQSLAAIPS